MDLTSETLKRFRVAPGAAVRLTEWDTSWEPKSGEERLSRQELKQQAADFVANCIQQLAGLQELLWADSRYSVLLIFQGADTSGKDSTIKHVTSGMNPAAMRVVSFKEPSLDELKRNYLWRYIAALPEQGYIGVFNRSYYEEVGVVRVNPELLKTRAMPQRPPDDAFWAERYEDINSLERQIVRNGTVIVKFFLHISKGQQKRQLLERLQDPTKHWKFSPADLTARERWHDYQAAYETMLSNTSTDWAPWWIMPADHRWAMRALVAQVMLNEMRKLDLRYPPVDDERRELIRLAIKKLKSEK